MPWISFPAICNQTQIKEYVGLDYNLIAINEDFVEWQEEAFKLLTTLQDRNTDQRIKDLKDEIKRFEVQASQMSNYKDKSNRAVRNNNSDLILQDSLIGLSKVNFDDLVDLETEKLIKSNYDVNQTARYHCRKVKEWRVIINKASRR